MGESEPSPNFYQVIIDPAHLINLTLVIFYLTILFLLKNLAEAEYCVAVFMYMRLIGYPAEKISILTTYNGQKHLIRDVVNIRCAKNPLIGLPHKVCILKLGYTELMKNDLNHSCLCLDHHCR